LVLVKRVWGGCASVFAARAVPAAADALPVVSSPVPLGTGPVPSATFLIFPAPDRVNACSRVERAGPRRRLSSNTVIIAATGITERKYVHEE
jgi:hypothetical protein